MSNLLNSGKVGLDIKGFENINDYDLMNFMSYALLLNKLNIFSGKQLHNSWESAKINYRDDIDMNSFFYENEIKLNDNIFNDKKFTNISLGNCYPDESTAYNNGFDVVDVKSFENNKSPFLRPFLWYEHIDFCNKHYRDNFMHDYNDEIFNDLITKKSNEYKSKDKKYNKKINKLKKIFNDSFDNVKLQQKVKVYNTISTMVKNNNASLMDCERFDVTALNKIKFNKPYSFKDNSKILNFIENKSVFALGNQYPENDFLKHIVNPCEIKENCVEIDMCRNQYNVLDESKYVNYSYSDRYDMQYKNIDNVLSEFRKTIISRNVLCRNVILGKTNHTSKDCVDKKEKYFFEELVNKVVIY